MGHSLLILSFTAGIISNKRDPVPRLIMPPTDNSDPEDFVFVDDPVHVASLKDVPIRVGTRKSPIEPDYVTVDVHNPIASAKPRVLADDHKQPMLHIEYFAPIPLGKIPQQITQVVLMAPAPTEDHVVEDEVSAPPSSHALLIKNVSMIFECFFHFQDVYAKIGRDSILYMVGKACELKAEGSSALRQHVGCILDTLREARVAFLRANKGKLILKSGDLSASELAKLVDRYISFTPEEPEPRSVSKKWYKDPAVEALWLGWKEVLVSKGLRMPKVRRDTGKDNNTS